MKRSGRSEEREDMPGRGVSFLVLLLTGRCNLRCRYCYVDADGTGMDMSRENAFRAIDTLASSNAATVELSGGEPLLRFDLLKDIVEYGYSVNSRLRFALQTNAILLDREKISYLSAHRVGLGISLDGVPDVNDRLRGRSEDVLNALRMMDELGVGVNITVVLTRENVGDFSRFLLFCAGFSCVRMINLDILRPVGRAEGRELIPERGRIADMVAGMFDVLAFINERRHTPLKVREIEQAFRRRNDRQVRPYCYGAAGEAAAVTPDGSLYPCASLVRMDKYRAGSVWDNDTPQLDGLVQSGLFPQRCVQCETRSVCRGGCPSRRLSHTGNIMDVCDIECRMRKEISRRIEE